MVLCNPDIPRQSSFALDLAGSKLVIEVSSLLLGVVFVSLSHIMGGSEAMLECCTPVTQHGLSSLPAREGHIRPGELCFGPNETN